MVDLNKDTISVPKEGFTVSMPTDSRPRWNPSITPDKPSPLDLPQDKSQCVHKETVNEDRTIYRSCSNMASDGWLCKYHQARLMEDHQYRTIREMEKAGWDRNDERDLIGLRMKMGMEAFSAWNGGLVGLNYTKYTRWGWWRTDEPAPTFRPKVEEDEDDHEG